MLIPGDPTFIPYLTKRLLDLPAVGAAKFPLPLAAVSSRAPKDKKNPVRVHVDQQASSNTGPVLLVLDTAIHHLPWEAMPILRVRDLAATGGGDPICVWRFEKTNEVCHVTNLDRGYNNNGQLTAFYGVVLKLVATLQARL